MSMSIVPLQFHPFVHSFPYPFLRVGFIFQSIPNILEDPYQKPLKNIFLFCSLIICLPTDYQCSNSEVSKQSRLMFMISILGSLAALEWSSAFMYIRDFFYFVAHVKSNSFTLEYCGKMTHHLLLLFPVS